MKGRWLIFLGALNILRPGLGEVLGHGGGQGAGEGPGDVVVVVVDGNLAYNAGAFLVVADVAAGVDKPDAFSVCAGVGEGVVPEDLVAGCEAGVGLACGEGNAVAADGLSGVGEVAQDGNFGLWEAFFQGAEEALGAFGGVVEFVLGDGEVSQDEPVGLASLETF